VIGIIDAHHHIWRQADLPWLIGPMQPRIFGPTNRSSRLSDPRIPRRTLRQWRRQVGLCADELGEGAVRGRDGLGAMHLRGTGWPHAIVAYADFGADDVRPQLDRLKRYRWCVAYACSCTGTRTRSTASPRAPICARTRRFVATSRASPTTTGASICRCSRRRSGRGQPRRSLSEGHVRAAARRNAGGPVPCRPLGLARRHGTAGGVSEHRLQALRAGHVHPSQ